MIPPLQEAILHRLASVLELSHDIRFGQLIAFLPEFVATDDCKPQLWDIEDRELLQALECHYQQLLAHKEQTAGPRS